ncbi:hypothetical protein [Pinisolibacter sp.]|uniref:hypothetical protein n=1 Tax=Pinisolibacter sp. TaxID=2172024 RepID=UPI002FDCEBFE
MSLQHLLSTMLPVLPLIVIALMIGVAASFGYRFVLALLGRPQPSESGPVTPVGRFLGRTLSMLLAPIQQILAIVAMFLVLSTILFLADRYRLYDDGLVDTTVTIVGRTRRCLDPGVDRNAALPTAPACSDTGETGRQVIDALDVTFVGAQGRAITAAAPLYLAKPEHRSPGDTFRASYYPAEPLRLGLHLSEMNLIGLDKLLLAGLVSWGLSMVVRRIRHRLVGKTDDDAAEEGGILGAVRGLFRRIGAALAGSGAALPPPDTGVIAARAGLGVGRPAAASEGFGRRRRGVDRG